MISSEKISDRSEWDFQLRKWSSFNKFSFRTVCTPESWRRQQRCWPGRRGPWGCCTGHAVGFPASCVVVMIGWGRRDQSGVQGCRPCLLGLLGAECRTQSAAWRTTAWGGLGDAGPLVSLWGSVQNNVWRSRFFTEPFFTFFISEWKLQFYWELK